MEGQVRRSLLQRRPEQPTIGGIAEPIQAKGDKTPNPTGLPDNLKAEIENLSGYSLDDVRVHYNSPKPAQLQALAYTQGTEIHVAPGQEEHLPHEAWHVVQQKQGRVKPTMQMKGAQINDDQGLEKEADVMGQDLLKKQWQFQHEGNKNDESFQKLLVSKKNDSKVKQLVKSNQPAQLKKSKKQNPTTEKPGLKRPLKRISGWSQDEIQKYLREIAPKTGPIRDFITNHADKNGGLCAGWVVLHREDPEALTQMWSDVAQKIKDNDGKGMGKSTEDAVKLYMKAQYHFAADQDNKMEGFQGPGEEVWQELGEPEDATTKSVKKSTFRVKYGEITKKANEFHELLNSSKKRVFIEIYTPFHTAQIEMAEGSLVSICETEKSGVQVVTDWIVAEKMLTSVFFEGKDEDATIELNFEGHVPKKK